MFVHVFRYVLKLLQHSSERISKHMPKQTSELMSKHKSLGMCIDMCMDMILAMPSQLCPHQAACPVLILSSSL